MAWLCARAPTPAPTSASVLVSGSPSSAAAGSSSSDPVLQASRESRLLRCAARMHCFVCEYTVVACATSPLHTATSATHARPCPLTRREIDAEIVLADVLLSQLLGQHPPALVTVFVPGQLGVRGV